MTDASLTKEEDSVKEAKENAQQLENTLNKLSSLRPELKSTIEEIRKNSHQLFKVGLEMTYTYWRKGQEAGDAIMKRPQTGLDAQSDILGGSLQKLDDLASHDQRASDSSLNNEVQRLQKVLISLSILSGIIAIFIFAALFKKMRPLNLIAEGLGKNSDNLTRSSQQLTHDSQSLATTGNSQAAATQQTAASLEQIRAMVEKTLNGADQLISSTKQSEELVSSGKSRIDYIVENLNRIETDTNTLVANVQNGNQEVKRITDVISEIGLKTKVINDIVFQTKLLSFNASVEAARAGDQGKGFAVVAEEVGNLAAMSGTAAKEIAEMLESGIQKVENIIKENELKVETAIESNKRTIAEGIDSAKACQETFDKIIMQTNEVTSVSGEMTQAISEQSKGLSEISIAVNSLDKIASENASTAASVSESSHFVSDAALNLTDFTHKIYEIVYGTKSLSISSPRKLEIVQNLGQRNNVKKAS